MVGDADWRDREGGEEEAKLGREGVGRQGDPGGGGMEDRLGG